MASDVSERHKLCLPLVKGKGLFRLCISVCLVAADPCQWSCEKQSSEDIWKEVFRWISAWDLLSGEFCQC